MINTPGKANLTFKLIAFFFFLFCLSGGMLNAQKKVVGYFIYGRRVSEIDFKSLTHINHSFIWPNKDGSLAVPDGLLNPQLISEAHAAGVKVLISLGSADSVSIANFAAMSADSLTRAAFIDNILAFVRNNNYDGIDIDWEFPANVNEKNQLTALVKGLRVAANVRLPNLLITMAVSPGDWFGRYFDYEYIVQYLNWVNIMGYNFHGSWTQHAGHNAPLYKNAADPDKLNPGSNDEGVTYLSVTRKIPLDKLVLGVPFYGREFNAGGLFAVQSGMTYDLIYNTDIVPKLNDAGWEYHWDDVSMVPYLQDTAHTKFITFDDTVSLRHKCDYVKNNDLAGIMIWALGYDFMNNESPLLKTIGNLMGLATGIELVDGDEINHGFKLYQNYPNPFNPTTVIGYQLPVAGHVTLKVFDLLGREIATIVDEYKQAGRYSVQLSAIGHQLTSGVYFYRLTAGKYSSTRKMILQR